MKYSDKELKEIGQKTCDNWGAKLVKYELNEKNNEMIVFGNEFGELFKTTIILESVK